MNILLKTIFTFLLVGTSNVVSFKFPPVAKTFDFVGDTEPTGYFDPLNLTGNIDDSGLKYLREAELHHGRIAMTSMVILPIIDFNSSNLSINELSSSSLSTQLSWLTYFSFYEWARIIAGYENFFKTGNVFKLKKDHIPGTLVNGMKLPTLDKEIQEKELNNGRLAMIGSLGYIAQEFITGEKIIGL